MIVEQTKEKHAAMKLRGMLSAFEQWQERGDGQLAPGDLLGLLVDAEWTARENRRRTQRLRQAHFPMDATVEEIDYQHPRGLRKSQVLDSTFLLWEAVSRPAAAGNRRFSSRDYVPWRRRPSTQACHSEPILRRIAR